MYDCVEVDEVPLLQGEEVPWERKRYPRLLKGGPELDHAGDHGKVPLHNHLGLRGRHAEVSVAEVSVAEVSVAEVSIAGVSVAAVSIVVPVCADD